MRVFGPRNSAYFDIPTTYIYVSREISIEHPSVGLANNYKKTSKLLSQWEKN